jgi:hypothetical protein
MITLTAKSQTSVYHPFPDSNAYWCGTLQSFDGMCDHTNNYTIYFGNDTLINGNMYHKLRQSGFTYSSLCGGGGYYYSPFAGAIRQDTLQQKVIIYFNSVSGDTILYDFNLHVGDTLDGSKVIWGSANYFIISSIDSILINGQYRKRYNYKDTIGCNLDSSIIEGIGGTSGLILAPSNCFEWFTSLTSFEQNGIGMYPDVSANCVIISAIKNILADNYLNIYPNPLFDKLNVTLNNNEPSEIILYDIASRKLLQRKFINSVSLNTEQLAKGIYLYEVRNKNGVIKKGKVVKE